MRGRRKPFVVLSACNIADAATDVVLKYAPPVSDCIARQSTAAVITGAIRIPLEIPLAVPVWLIKGWIKKILKIPLPLVGWNLNWFCGTKKILTNPLV